MTTTTHSHNAWTDEGGHVSDPLAELLPTSGAGALLNGGGHENGKRRWACARWQIKKVGLPDLNNVKLFCALWTQTHHLCSTALLIPPISSPDHSQRSSHHSPVLIPPKGGRLLGRFAL